MKSELIFTEDGNLQITKPNGLRYSFDNCDAPDLGFDYEMLVYADLEIKIVNWKDGVDFEKQDALPLTDEEKDAIELYIENSEPPIGFNLNQQHKQEINNICHEFIKEVVHRYGFDCAIFTTLPTVDVSVPVHIVVTAHHHPPRTPNE